MTVHSLHHDQSSASLTVPSSLEQKASKDRMFLQELLLNTPRSLHRLLPTPAEWIRPKDLHLLCFSRWILHDTSIVSWQGTHPSGSKSLHLDNPDTNSVNAALRL